MSNKNALVIEDERPLAEAIRLKLTKEGFVVETAQTVADALAILEEKQIDVIWLDHYLLGKEDGIDLVSKLKQEDSKFKMIPIFVVSNTASPEKVQTYISLGVDRYYVKAEHRLDEIVSDVINQISS